MHVTLWTRRLLAVLLVGLAVLFDVVEAGWDYKQTGNSGIHGGVQMGVSNDECDNAKVNLTVDWNYSMEDYMCQGRHWVSNENYNTDYRPTPTNDCQKDNLDPPLHKCMFETIEYSDPIPTAGAHRPLWAKFGEYQYLPKQRWVHNLEHGCAVFLYHPCADPSEVQVLRQIARSCLRKHIITPLKELSREKPFAVVTYGCKILLPRVDEMRIVDFLRDHAIDAPEKGVVADGQFDAGLEKSAKIVSDMKDSRICPQYKAQDEDTEFEHIGNVYKKWLGLLTDMDQ